MATSLAALLPYRTSSRCLRLIMKPGPYDIWNMKYSKRFKWDKPSENIAYLNAVREQRLAAEISAAKKERDSHLSKIHQSRLMAAMEERKKKVLLQVPHRMESVSYRARPALKPFPLVGDIESYEANTIDLSDESEREYWLKGFANSTSHLAEKAMSSEGGTTDAKRRGEAFAQAFKAHLARLREEPAAAACGLANLFEKREDCLREFQFQDVYLATKQRESEAAIGALPDLLAEMDSLDPGSERLLALIQGVLAGNIFDWGARACRELYESGGTILEIHRMSRENLTKRPWRVDDFDAFHKRLLMAGNCKHKLALLFVDNSGADIVLGMLPLARELLRRGSQVVLVANSLPAINDVTASELPSIIAAAAKHCDILRRSAAAGGLPVDDDLTKEEEDLTEVASLSVVGNGCGGPCIDLRQVSSELASLAMDADLVVLEGMGRSFLTNFNAKFKCDVLKLCMVKDQRLAEQILNGSIYDCVCRFEPTNQ